MTNPILEKYYLADIDDRKAFERGNITSGELDGRDRVRCEWLKNNWQDVDHNDLLNLHYAALLLMHSLDRKDYSEAHKLAGRAVRMGSRMSKWLYAASYDRDKVSRGKKQKFATQYIEEKGEKLYFPVEKILPDEKLAEYGVESMHGKKYLENHEREEKISSK